MRRQDSIFSISDRLTEVLANETLTDDLDRKWFLDTHSCCCLWPPPLLLTTLCITQIILYYFNSVAEHPLVLHPLRLHEPWRYVTYFLVHIDLISLIVNLFVQLVVGLPLELVHGSFRVALIYGCGVLFGALAASIFDPHVRLAGNINIVLFEPILSLDFPRGKWSLVCYAIGPSSQPHSPPLINVETIFALDRFASGGKFRSWLWHL